MHIERYDEDTPIPPMQGGGSGSDRINLVAPIRRNGLEFIPLVRKSLHLACGLRIIFLRKEEPGSLILQGGDIDNRIKTLFDTLKIPDEGDLPDEPVPPVMYSLLESDSLIIEESVETDRLLIKPDADKHEVNLLIQVSVKVSSCTDDGSGVNWRLTA